MDDFTIVIDILLRGVLALSGIAMAYILIAFYFPRFIMKPRVTGEKMGDRGIKRYTYENGRGVVYEPEIAARKYVKQYMLFTKDGTKYVKCLIEPRVKYLNYDILVFDNKNKLIDLINVDEQLKGGTMTKAVPIVAEASYISLVLRCADNMYENRKIRVDYSYVSCILYGGLSALCIAIAGTLMNSFVAHLFSASRISFPSSGSAFISFLLIGLVFGAALVLLYKTKYRRGIN